MKSKRIIEIKDLNFSFKNGNQSFTLDKISFHVTKGETLGIIGESGSGKTVTALSMLQLLDPTLLINRSGEIIYDDGVPINLAQLSENDMSKIRMKEISMIFQNPISALNPRIQVGKQIEEVIKLHLGENAKEARIQARTIFERVGFTKSDDLDRIFRSYPHQISGGQAQRIMIAMAISCKAKIIIADEPTTSLDVVTQSEILDLLLQVKQELGCTIILISHDFDVIKKMCNAVAVMFQGQILEKGTLDQILNVPKHPYTKALLATSLSGQGKSNKLPVSEDFFEVSHKNGKLVFEEKHFDINRFHKKKVKESEIAKINKLPAILELLNLRKIYTSNSIGIASKEKRFSAIQDLNLTLFQGECLGLVGESGSGKSTLARLIMGLESVDEGKILFRGNNLFQFDSNQLKSFRQEVQIIFQNPLQSLDPLVTIGKSIEEPIIVHKLINSKVDRRERVMHLLDQVGLDANLYDRYPKTLSGGQLQRVCIARALALNPKVLLCDECVSSLDVSIQAQILNLLKDLQIQYGLSLLFISHDLNVVRFIADRIAVIHHGEIIEIGNPDELFNNPTEPYTKSLIEALKH